jgi:hypothetical protein
MLWDTPITPDIWNTWLVGEMRGLGKAPFVLLALLPFAPAMRRAIDAGRWGETVEPWRSDPRLAGFIMVLPIASWLAALAWANLRPESFIWATNEDGLIEWIQAGCLGLACYAAWDLARMRWRAGNRRWASAFAVVALGTFLVMGEEISWGQRLLHLPTPAWFAERNTQQEINVHNLGNINSVLSDWFDYLLMWTCFVAAAGSLTRFRRVRRLQAHLWMMSPVWVPALLCVHSWGSVLRLWHLLHPAEEKISELVSRLQEPKELILYAALAGFLLSARHAQRRLDLERALP